VDWTADESIAKNVKRMIPEFKEFIAQGPALELDGFVIEWPEGSYGSTLGALSRTTRQVLNAIWEEDPLRTKNWLEDIETPNWFYSFSGQRLFVLATGPCYDHTSSRYTYGALSTYLLFQPQHSFQRRASPLESGTISRAHRNKIRQAFKATNQTYDLSITLGPIEAFRFVKPRNLGDPPVRWWEVGDE
jgi:hypothetical protein